MRRASGLPRRSSAALAARGLLLGCRPALARIAPGRARAGLLPAAARSAGRVRDPRGTFLRHPLFLELLVLLLVLDAWSLVRHRTLLLRRRLGGADQRGRGGFAAGAV